MAYNAYLAVTACIALSLGYFVWKLFPATPLPGYPHNAASRRRLFGDGPEIKGTGRITREPSAAIFNLNRKLGTALFQLLVTGFGPPRVVLDDPREVEDILLRRNKEFDRSVLTTNLFHQVLPHATLSQATTPALKAQKRLWSDAMSPEFLRRAVAPNLQVAARELVELWAIKAESAAGAPFDVSRDFQDMALDAIWAGVLGSKAGVLRYEIEKLRDGKSTLGPEALHTIEVVRFAVTKGTHILDTGLASLWPGLTFFFMRFTPSYRRFKQVGRDEVRKLMRRACERFQALPGSEKMGGAAGHDDDNAEHDTCAMDLVLRREIMMARKTGTPVRDPTNDLAMLDELWLMLLAGHDSTANTLSWFVKYMALHRDTQAQLRRALTSAFGSRPSQKLPTAAAILAADIPFLDAVMEETTRCAATAALTSRDALVDTEVLGRPVPAGSTVILNLNINHTPYPIDESVRSATSRAVQAKRTRGGFDSESGRDLEQFEPRRWLAKDADGREVFDAYSLPSLTFGGGFRGCFGASLCGLLFCCLAGRILTGMNGK